MKTIIALIVSGLLFASCSTQQKTTGNQDLKEVVNPDSTEYGVLILDPEFDHWYLTRYSTAMDRDNEVYRMYNRTAVMNWNDYYIRGKYRNIIENNLNYDYHTDYGIEVNRKLYWYFRFIEEKYKIRLLN
jgi:hypothetical protein